MKIRFHVEVDLSNEEMAHATELLKTLERLSSQMRVSLDDQQPAEATPTQEIPPQPTPPPPFTEWIQALDTPNHDVYKETSDLIVANFSMEHIDIFVSALVAAISNPRLHHIQRREKTLPYLHVLLRFTAQQKEAIVNLRLVKHLLKEIRAPGTDIYRYMAPCDAMACLVYLKLVKMPAALTLVTRLLASSETRTAGFTTLGKLIEICHEAFSHLPPTTGELRDIHLQLQQVGVEDPTRAYEIDYMRRYLPYYAESLPPTEGSAEQPPSLAQQEPGGPVAAPEAEPASPVSAAEAPQRDAAPEDAHSAEAEAQAQAQEAERRRVMEMYPHAAAVAATAAECAAGEAESPPSEEFRTPSPLSAVAPPSASLPTQAPAQAPTPTPAPDAPVPAPTPTLAPAPTPAPTPTPTPTPTSAPAPAPAEPKAPTPATASPVTPRAPRARSALSGRVLHCVKSFASHKGRVTSLTAHPNQSLLFSTSTDYTVHVWTPDSPPSQPHDSLTIMSETVCASDFVPQCNALVLACVDPCMLVLVRVNATGRFGECQQLPIETCCTSIKSLENRLLLGTQDGSIQMRDLAQPEPPVALFNQHTSVVTSLASLPCEPTCFLSGGMDNNIHLWDARQPQAPMSTMARHKAAVTSVRTDSDTCFLSTSLDKNVFLWDIRKPHAPLMETSPVDTPIFSSAFVPGQRRATVSTEYGIFLTDFTVGVVAMTENRVHSSTTHAARPIYLDLCWLDDCLYGAASDNLVDKYELK